jgi:putative oxidoreductase
MPVAVSSVVARAELPRDAGVPPIPVPLQRALLALRVGTALLFMAHAIVRVMTPGSVANFGRFFDAQRIPYGVAVVWMITAFELLGGVLLTLGIRTRLMSAGFATILVVGIALIHRRLGWFVGEHGTGGSEYSVALLLALLVIAAADAPRGMPVPAA